MNRQLLNCLKIWAMTTSTLQILIEDYTSPLLDSILRDSLVRINRGLPVEAIDEALAKLKNFDTGSLLQKNMIFMDYLQNGITVKFFVKGEEQSSIVRLIDYANAKNNSFYVVNQFTFLENGNNRRPDIILFINGFASCFDGAEESGEG